MKTLVFVHGYLGGGSQWADQKATFGKHFQVVTPDLPGYADNNQSTTPESIRGLAMNVFQQLDTLGVHRFHLVGHSMGGMISQQFALDYPEKLKSLTLASTTCRVPKGAELMLMLWTDILEKQKDQGGKEE